MKKTPEPHNGAGQVPPASVQGEDREFATVQDLDDPVYGLRASLLKARAIAVCARAADHEELQLQNEPDKNTLAHLMAVLIEQLDAAEDLLEDYIFWHWHDDEPVRPTSSTEDPREATSP